MPAHPPPPRRGGRSPRPVRRGRRRSRSGPRKRLVLFLPADLVKVLRSHAGLRAEALDQTVEDLLRLGLRAARGAPA